MFLLTRILVNDLPHELINFCRDIRRAGLSVGLWICCLTNSVDFQKAAFGLLIVLMM